MLSPAVEIRLFAAETAKRIASQIPDPDRRFCAVRPLCSCAKHRGRSPKACGARIPALILPQAKMLARNGIFVPSVN